MNDTSKGSFLLNDLEDNQDLNMKDIRLPYVLFSLRDNIYGINSKFVLSINVSKAVTDIVGSPDYIKGGMTFNGSFINIIDTRALFGLNSQIDDFNNEVNPEQRIYDHEHWVDTLENSVLNGTEFTLTDDPHKCALGKWYYSFETSNYTLKNYVKKIEWPHSEVHKTAKRVKELMKNNERERALDTVNELRHTHFTDTINILSSLRKAVEENLKELFIIIESDGYTRGIVVDNIIGIEYLDEMLSAPENSVNKKHIKFVSKYKKEGELVFILDEATI